MYLRSLVIPLLFWVAGFLLFKKNRKLILLSSILAFPQGILAIILVPVYWKPDYQFGTQLGIEDLIFSFFSGGCVWITILLVSRNEFSSNLNFIEILKKFLYCSSFGIPLTILFYILGLRGIENQFIIMIAWTILILMVYPDRLRIIIYGMFSFIVLHIIGLLIARIFWPEIHSLWTLEGVLSSKFLGVVLGEYVWAFLYGASWSAALAYILDIKIKKTDYIGGTIQTK